MGTTKGARSDEALARLRAVSDMPGVIAVLRETARAIAGSDGIAVVLRDGAFCHYITEDAIGLLWRGRRFRLKDCIFGWVMLNRLSAVVHDTERDTRLPVAAYQAASMRSLMAMPIGSPEPLGRAWRLNAARGAGTQPGASGEGTSAPTRRERVRPARSVRRPTVPGCRDNPLRRYDAE